MFGGCCHLGNGRVRSCLQPPGKGHVESCASADVAHLRMPDEARWRSEATWLPEGRLGFSSKVAASAEGQAKLMIWARLLVG